MTNSKAMILLKILKDLSVDNIYNMEKDFDEAIKELDAYITNYQGIKRRLNNALDVIDTMNKAKD